MENLLRDFRYGMGSLARDPGFAAVTIGLLTLGIGANRIAKRHRMALGMKLRGLFAR